ncbi:MAG: HK97 family phage prohead protease [Bacteroidales bacterium]|nr:HK97 family phage prohead protease [Bacteroidales bacterium]
MALEFDFVINDGSVNRYGYRIHSAGIKLEAFKKNPVCPYMHEGRQMSLGKWKNLRLDGDKLLGTLEFDEDDPIAVLLYKKYSKGYQNAVSLSVLPITESDDASWLVAGQRYPTLVESELLEISPVTVPGNANAIKLVNRQGEVVKLSLIKNAEPMTGQRTVEQLTAEMEQLQLKLATQLVDFHKSRGVVPDSERDFLISAATLKYDSTKTMLEARVASGSGGDTADKLAEQLVELHFKRGAITDGEKAFYVNAAKHDYEGAKKALELRKGTDVITAFIQEIGTGNETAQAGAENRAGWGYLDWYKKDLSGLELMKKEKRADYDKLFKAHQDALKASGKVNLDKDDED